MNGPEAGGGKCPAGGLCECGALSRYAGVGTARSEGEGGRPERFKGFSAGPGARAPGPAGPFRRPGCLSRARAVGVPESPADSSQSGAPTATPGPLRQRLAQGHPAVADLGGPERLEIPPRFVRWPFGGAVGVRRGGLGFEPKPGERLCPDFAGVCLC